MAHGLVKIGSKRILPAPRSNVMRFVGMSAGGGSPGGGFGNGEISLLTQISPNSPDCGACNWQDITGSGWLILMEELPGAEGAMSSEQKDTISAMDENYVEVVTYNNGNCDGHRLRYDVSAYDFTHFSAAGYAYGWRTSDSAYGVKIGVWDWVAEEHVHVKGHSAETCDPYTTCQMNDEYVLTGDCKSGEGIISNVIQGIDPFNDNDQEAYLRHYCSFLALYK